MMMLLAVIVLASGVALRMLWQTANLHADRLTNARQQQYTATLLLETGRAQYAADLWKLHWTATQPRFDSYSDENHWPRLHWLYQQQPYQINQRIEDVGGRANDGKKIPQQVGPAAMLLSGLRTVTEELESNRPPQLRFFQLASLCILPALIFWGLLYHLFIYLPLRNRTQRVTLDYFQKSDEVDSLTYNDPLTATANRKAVTQFLSNYQNDNTDEFIALAVLDLDHFQQINDVFGYFAGDAVLKEVAIRISEELREDDQLGRMNSDHFAIVLCGLVAPKNAEQIIDRIQTAIAKPIHYKQNTLNITCTVGAAVQQIDSIDVAELFKLSDQALQQAKHNRRGSVFLLSDSQQQALSRQREVINTIKNQAPDDVFDLVFQPIVDLKSRKITGCECLLRWKPLQPEALSASELIQILEMSGDINEVGFWILKKSMRQLHSWKSSYQTELVMSINVSARQLEATDFSETISLYAKELELAPSSISLELTETVAIKHLEAGRQQLAACKNYGFNISLDDFGTGYSSLQYLKQMPATSVKIDQSFVREMLNDERDMAIVKGAAEIASAIGLKVIAEGIDTEAQASCLQDLGCQFGQGFLFSKPLNATDFEQRIKSRGVTDINSLNNPPAA